MFCGAFFGDSLVNSESHGGHFLRSCVPIFEHAEAGLLSVLVYLDDSIHVHSVQYTDNVNETILASTRYASGQRCSMYSLYVTSKMTSRF